MRLRYLILALAALLLGTAGPVYAEETMNGPVYIVTYFDVAPTAAQQSSGIVREFADASRKADGNAGFAAFEEIADQPACAGGDDHRVRLGQGLQPGGEVRRFADDRLFLSRS